MTVPADKIENVIGADGKNIQGMENETRTRITRISHSIDRGSNPPTVTISMKAIATMCCARKPFENSPISVDHMRAGRESRDGDGTKGQTVQKIQSETNTFITS